MGFVATNSSTCLHLQALQVYPRSATLAGMLADCERRAHTASRLRRELGLMCEETAAVALWLLALRSEALLPAGAHRVQVRAAIYIILLQGAATCTLGML